MEKPPPVLGQQPPIPRTNQLAAINFTQIEEFPWEQTQELVPIGPYVDEGSSISSSIIETQGYKGFPPMYPPQLDVETLLFVARNNMKPQRTNPMDKKDVSSAEQKIIGIKNVLTRKDSHTSNWYLGFVMSVWCHTCHYTVPKTL